MSTTMGPVVIRQHSPLPSSSFCRGLSKALDRILIICIPSRLKLLARAYEVMSKSVPGTFRTWPRQSAPTFYDKPHDMASCLELQMNIRSRQD
jgi:hypothetical protein